MACRTGWQTDGITDRVVELWGKGITFKQIALRLGLDSRHCAYHRYYHRHGPLSMDRRVSWSSEEVDLALARKKEGWTARAVANELGRSRNSVIGKVWRERGKRSKTQQ